MRILMVLDHPFPPDVRVENEIRTLARAGHEVAILAIGPDDRPSREQTPEVRIMRQHLPARIRNWLRGLSGTISLPSWLLARRIRKAHREWPFDALHMHDLYLFGGGIRAGKALGVPVVGDLHENWVEALKHYAWSTSFPGRLVVSIPRWERLEREWVNAVDRLIVVVREAGKRNKQLGVEPFAITEVPNTIQIEEFERLPIRQEIVERVRARTDNVVVYTGGMDIHRGLDRAIRAMQDVRRRIPDAELVLVGDGRIRADLEALAAELGLSDAIRFLGWQPQEDIWSYIAASAVCIVPHRRTIHTDATLPHKLFHYMYAGRPVVVTDCKPIKRIVHQEGCGLVVPDGNTSAMGYAIARLLEDRESANAMAAAGHEAALQRWNWEATERGLVQLYADLESERA